MSTVIATSVISSTIMLIITFFINKNLKKIEEKTEAKHEEQEQKLQMIADSHTGIMILLQAELKRSFDKCTEGGYCSWEERGRISKVYELYHSMGGNGNGTDIYRKIIDLPMERRKKDE